MVVFNSTVILTTARMLRLVLSFRGYTESTDLVVSPHGHPGCKIELFKWLSDPVLTLTTHALGGCLTAGHSDYKDNSQGLLSTYIDYKAGGLGSRV